LPLASPLPIAPIAMTVGAVIQCRPASTGREIEAADRRSPLGAALG
jgi:hypothetical protein